MRRKFYLLISLLFIFHATGVAQDKDTSFVAPPGKKPYNFKQFLNEGGLFLKQPAKWKGKDYIILGGTVAATVGIMQFDQRIRNTTGNPDSLHLQKFVHSFWVEGGRMYGTWYAIPGVASIFGLYGIIANNNKAKVLSIELIQSGLFSEALTSVLKSSIGRARPYLNENPYSYHPFSIFNYDYHSLPSGHATSAFALSTVISRTSEKTIFKILAYVPAAFTLFSRVYQDRHWASDEFAGAAIGYFVGNWVVDLHTEKKNRIKVKGMLQ